MAVQLGNKNVGNIVKLRENGVLTDFIVVHKGKPSPIYDDSFLDSVILLRQSLVESRRWHTSSVNDYANSALDTWLNGAYYNTIDANIRTRIKQVRIPYRAGSGTSMTVSSGANGLQRRIFLLSGYEVGSGTNTYLPPDGATLSRFSGIETTGTNARRIANLDGTATTWWLRSPYTNGSTYAWVVGIGGNTGGNGTYTFHCGVRPALVLPSSIWVANNDEIIPYLPPTITSGTVGDIGAVSADFAWQYVVNHEGGEVTTVTESINGVNIRTYTATLGAANTFDVSGLRFMTLLNGPITMTVTATSSGGGSAMYTVTATKAVHAASVTLSDPLPADAMPTAIRLNISGHIPQDAVWTVEVCNNARDAAPTWEDIKPAVLAGVNYPFTNTTKTAAEWGVNFRVYLSRGESNTGGYIFAIEGGYQ